MATLLNNTSQKTITLRSQHIFGRHSGSSNTFLSNLEASRLHASILWNGSYWLLQDTSSNGTFINNKMLISGSKKRLKVGDIIQFGSLNSCQFKFNNNDAPKSLLVSIENESNIIELEGIVALPDDKSPVITLYQSTNGNWVYEDQSGVIPLEVGTKISFNENNWYFVNADTFDETKKAESISSLMTANIKNSFNVSKDEEHVSLCINFENQQIDLGERTHHYLLLILARKRLEDKLSGLDEFDQGWIDKNLLSQQIGLDENYINILIYRFRKQLSKAKPSAMNLLQMIERRRGEIRFAFTTIEINGVNN